MKNPGERQIDSYLRTFAFAILIASLILAGRNAPAHNNKPPVRIPIHNIRDHDLQVGNA